MENPHRVGNSVRETREKLLQIREDWKGKGGDGVQRHWEGKKGLM
jgi:hypothetical protein